MSDYLPDTGVVGRYYCPACELEADPQREVLTVRMCPAHEPTTEGAEDARVAPRHLSGATEADGETCRLFAELLHRGKAACPAG